MISTLKFRSLLTLELALLAALLAAYVLYLNVAINLTADRRSLDLSAADLQSEIASLEQEYAVAATSINLADARSLGFVELKNQAYLKETTRNLSLRDTH